MGIFDKIFNKNKFRLADYTDVMTDMHSHLISGVDDGSKSIDDSVEMIKNLYNLGYKKLITTPHIMGDSYKLSVEEIKRGLEALKTAIKNSGIPIELEAAAEYMIDDRFEERMNAGRLLTFGKNYLLIELPFIFEPENFSKLLFDLQSNGYRVILAHPERYTYWYGNLQKYEDLFDRGVYLQMNTVSLTGFYSLPTKKIAEWLIDKEMISFIGSDVHSQIYIDSLTKALDDKYLFKLVTSGKLLNYKL